MRFAEGMWEIALKHESYVATEMVLKELLEIQRLDFGDRYQAGGMAIINPNCYEGGYFCSFWIRFCQLIFYQKFNFFFDLTPCDTH